MKILDCCFEVTADDRQEIKKKRGKKSIFNILLQLYTSDYENAFCV